MIDLQGKFRGSLGEMKDADSEKKKRILRMVAALEVKIFDEAEGINPDEESEEEDTEWRGRGCRWGNLKDDNTSLS